jgi:hypothetical protein
MNRALPSIAALSEATFPENEISAPDWKSTCMVDRTVEYLGELPPAQRRLLLLLFLFVEYAALVLVFGFCRFSKLNPSRRTAVIRGWRRSRFFPLRMLGDAVKATTTMMYMSHPSVIEHIGEYRVCDWSSDPLKIAVRDDALKAMQDTP